MHLLSPWTLWNLDIYSRTAMSKVQNKTLRGARSFGGLRNPRHFYTASNFPHLVFRVGNTGIWQPYLFMFELTRFLGGFAKDCSFIVFL